MQEAIAEDMQIIVTPTFDHLAEHAQNCASKMIVGSPFVNGGLIELANLVPKNVSQMLITRTDLRDFAIRASNLDSLCVLAQNGMTIKSMYKSNYFHAKVYIFDESFALVTSANATYAGLRRNLECGLGTSDKELIRKLTTQLLNGFGASEPPRQIELAELQGLQTALENVEVTLPNPTDGMLAGDNELIDEASYYISDRDALMADFDGWQKLTLNEMLNMPESEFGLQELLDLCEPVAAIQYPENNNVRAKLRQQLQFLRDFGLVEFVRPGRYKRTMNPKDAR